MLEADSAVNPYAPATDVAPPGVDVSELLPAEFLTGQPIRFAGQVTDEDLLRFLKQSAPRGLLVTLAITVVLFGLMYFNAVTWPWQMLLGGIALVVIVLNLSLSPYVRINDYTSSFVHWDAQVTGYFDSTGYCIDDQFTENWQSWTSVSNAYADDQVIAFQSALQPTFSRLITREMVGSDEDWRMLAQVARAIHCDVNISSVSQSRIAHACDRLADEQRPRTLPVPEQAIAFAGELTTEDLPYLEADRETRNDRPTTLLSLLLMIAISVVLAGLTGLAFEVTRPFELTLVYGAGLGTIVAIWKWLQRQRPRRGQRFLTLLGFIDDETLTFDFQICWRRVRLESCEFDRVNEHRIVMRERVSNTHATLRADMFESPENWAQAQRMAQGATLQ